jgi:hypothetical protein
MKNKIGRPESSRICDIEGCSKTHYAKGFCRTHYLNYRYNNDEKFRKEVSEKSRKRVSEHYQKMIAIDPDWGAKRQREYRNKYPDRFRYIMCRCYFRKLTNEQKKNLIEECGMK